MSFDRISEEIAHFIGMFHLEVEENRLRVDYDAFKHERDEKARENKEVPDLVVSAPYKLKGFDPELVYKAVPTKVHATVAQAYGAYSPDAQTLGFPNSAPPVGAPDTGNSPAFLVDWQISWPPFVPVPNSILASIQQTAELWDNDLLLATGTTAFVAPEVLIAELLELVEAARDLSVFGDQGPVLPTLPDADAAMELAEGIKAFTPGDGPAETQLILRGEDAKGTYLNGELLEPQTAGKSDTGDGEPAEAEEDTEGLPNFFDILHEYLAEKYEEDEAEPEKNPLDGVLAEQESPYAVDPGQEVVTGANLVINETSIVKAWVDAPVIAVAGDAVRLDVVSQVNAMESTAKAFGGDTAAPSETLNGVSIEYESTADPEDSSPAASGVFPQNWTVVSIAADVFAVNWVQQYVFASDFDRTEITISTHDTFIGTGENVIANGVQLAELGFHYDLIMVGGNMVTMNIVDQTNVLVDVDTIGAAATGPVNLMVGDNLQYNRAELKQTGLDQMTEMQDNFRTAMKDVAEGKKDLAKELAEDARFEGKAELKALHIKGDLIKASIIEQYNFLGDSDQVELILDDFSAGGGAVKLVTGSNAQLNAAKIHDIGLDSEVMVGGEAYSDALIYQAELIDHEAPPAGVGMSPLASEAVAFLADDMLEADGDDYSAGPGPFGAEHPASSDVMHSIIS
jgi:hypothetical protein